MGRTLSRFADDARSFGKSLPAFAPRLAEDAPEPETGRIARGLLAHAENAYRAAEAVRDSFIDRIAERACPWWSRPIPASSVIEFAGSAAPTVIKRGERIPSRSVDDVTCIFKTLRAVELTPFRVKTATLDAPPNRSPILAIELVADRPVDRLPKDLALFVGGDREAALALVHAITRRAVRASAQSPEWVEPRRLPLSAITRMGLSASEALAPDPDGAAAPFGVVTESVVAPDKFRFFAVSLSDVAKDVAPARSLTLTIVLAEGVEAPPGDFDVRTNCVPVANLFDATAEPLAFDPVRRPTHLRVTGLRSEHGGIYSVRDVYAARAPAWSPLRLPDQRRHTATLVAVDAPASFSVGRDGDELRLHLAARHSVKPGDARFVISTRVLATNRSHAAQLRPGDIRGALATASGALPYASVVPASRYVPRPSATMALRRVLLEAAVRTDARGPVESLRRAVALAVPSWAMTDDENETLGRRVAGFADLAVKLAQRPTAAGAKQVGYGYELRLDESAFRGPGELGLFGAALSEALSRSLPFGTHLELAITGTRTGGSTIYVEGIAL